MFGSNYIIGAISVYKLAAIANNLIHFSLSETVNVVLIQNSNSFNVQNI